MLTALLLSVLSGNDVCLQSIQKVQAIQSYGYVQQIQAQYVPLYVAQPVSYGTDAERIRKLEDAIEQLTIIASQQQQLIQMGGVGTVQNGVSDVERKAKQVIAANCLSCHKGETAKADLDLSLELTIGEKLIAESVASGEMPPGKQLKDADKQAVFDWSREDREALRDYLRSK